MINQHQSLLLGIVGYQLFGGERVQVDSESIAAVLKEATAQTVFTTVFPYVKETLKQTDIRAFIRANEHFLGNVMQNTNNFMEHSELHELLSKHRIAYTTLKGLASAYYYPEASLRDMGDVDFLVDEQDFETVRELVMTAGFQVDHGDDADSIHIAYHRHPCSIWEQHRSVNGIPAGLAGERIRAEIDKTIETAERVTLDGAVCMIPDAMHHGLIMLLHMISHMTSEGIGLRHLCDWAVFAQAIDNDAFVAMFEEKLKKFGLWKFAQMMTLVSEKYLGISHKAWSENSETDAQQLEEIMTDILDGGNFGKKDANRYREIKYISNRGERTVDNKNLFFQAVSTLNQKVYGDYPWIDSNKFLLPVGWAAEGGRYIGLLISGQRKNKGTSAMLKEAAKRKDIYSKMELFQTE